jgi:hypothetical protein
MTLYPQRPVLGLVVAPFAAAAVLWLLALALYGLGGSFGSHRLGEALAAATLVGAVGLLYFGIVPTLLLGVPLYLLLRNRLRPSARRAMMFGGLLSGLPYSLFFLAPFLLYWGRIGNAQEALLHSVLPFLAVAIALGAFGGWVFWRIAYSGPRLAAP